MDDFARLKWQCRRGTKELDFLLNRYLETGYLLAAQEEKALFRELLLLEDDKLIRVLLGDVPPDANKATIDYRGNSTSQYDIKRLLESVQKGYSF